MNNYKEQYERSISDKDKEWWQAYFKDEINWDVSLEDEYAGIDCIINNKKIQLKLREQVYNDILIEFAHSNGEKGWINKSQKCNYIIFGWRSYDNIFIFDWLELCKFWRNNQVRLFQKYKKQNVQAAINEKKITYNYSIPFSELRSIYKIKTL